MTWATSVPILVFLGLSILDLGPMYTTDVRRDHRLMPPALWAGHNNGEYVSECVSLLQVNSAPLQSTYILMDIVNRHDHKVHR